MTVRPARFSDIEKIIDLAGRIHAKSRFSESEINRYAAEASLTQIVGGPREAKIMAMAAFVTKDVTGFIAGSLMPLYLALDIAVLTDQMWIVDMDRAGPRDGMALLSALHSWARTYNGRVIAQHHMNDSIVNPDVTGRMMQRAGFRCIGHIYEKEIKA